MHNDFNLTLMSMRRLGVAWAAALVSFGLVSMPAHGQRPGGGPPGPLPVIVAPAVVDADFGDTMEALGTTKANEAVAITANVTEFVREVRFNDGDRVRKGDVLVVLEKDEEEAALKAARASLDERAGSLGRARELVQQQAISTATVAEREALLRQLEGSIEGIDAQIRDRIIRAPFDGVLGLRQISVGALVRPGDVITTLDDLSVIKVDFDAPSVFLSALQPGLAIRGTVDAFKGEVFTGHVATITTRVDPVTRTVAVRALLPNDDGRMVPGLLMAIAVMKNPRPGLVVPESAILQRGNQHFVYVVSESEGGPIATEKLVRPGARRPGFIEIREGLHEGDLVVVHGLMQVRSGQSVEIRGVQTGDEPLASFTGDQARFNGGP